MALCLPRKRRATSLATRPRTLSVASITNHSCVTSAGLALKVFMSFSYLRRVCWVLFHGRRSSDENLLGGDLRRTPSKANLFWSQVQLCRGTTCALQSLGLYGKSWAGANFRRLTASRRYDTGMFSYRHAFLSLI